ncbi:MAG TPA: hypothetical protein VLC28_04515 [Flavitalea sp.]|nr:hypothetical protein [Flavitalea sp.]
MVFSKLPFFFSNSSPGKMLDELSKYKDNDHFFFRATDDLNGVCNVPDDKSGVFLIYALKSGRIELVYIGHSGEIQLDGTAISRKVGLGGLKDTMINGKQFGQPRRKSLQVVMNYERIEALDIYWFVTHSDKYSDNPGNIERELVRKHVGMYGRPPKWNI